MKIESYNMNLSSEYQKIVEDLKEEKINAWKDQPTEEVSPVNPLLIIEISDTNFPENEITKTEEDIDYEDYLPEKYKLLKELIERMTGKKMNLLNPADLQKGNDKATKSAENVQNAIRGYKANASQAEEKVGWGIEYSLKNTHYEKEEVQFKSAGQIKLKDGRTINFSNEFHLNRELYQERNFEFAAGDALIDPLVINIDENSVNLTEEKFEFDLNSDGKNEEIGFVDYGSGYLVLDRNANGIVDNGNELFGPKTGDGFAELAEFDSDDNNWIDENDPIFYDLKIWRQNIDGEKELSSLTEDGIGAIFLGNVKTNFDMQNGIIRNSGIFLNENGESGLIQQIDLKV